LSKVLIYLIAVFALWMYFSFSKSANGGKEQPTIKDFDAAGSGSGGTLVSNTPATWGEGGGFGSYQTNGGRTQYRVVSQNGASGVVELPDGTYVNATLSATGQIVRVGTIKQWRGDGYGTNVIDDLYGYRENKT